MFPNYYSAIKCFLGGACAIIAATLPNVSQATSFNVLYSFTGGSDGGNPAYGNLVLDKNGNLYGTTSLPLGTGAVFKLTADGVESVLYYFPGGSGGAGPEALVMDNNGNLWGTACCGGIGSGVIFKINSTGEEKLVHTFAGQPNDGSTPFGALILGSDGRFYGTTTGGGKYNVGTVLKLALDGTDTVLYSFNDKRSGNDPFAGLTMDANANLYGADAGGGARNFGTVFGHAHDGTETVLHVFKGPPNDGSTPDGALVVDQSGNLYGTAFTGGHAGCYSDEGCGAAFMLAPGGAETILHFFTGKHGDGANPIAGLIADAAGNFFGTTEFGGGRLPCNGFYGCGTVFEIAPDGTETILHSFGDGSKGANPVAGLVADGKGNFFGTASDGGAYGYGTVFEITP